LEINEDHLVLGGERSQVVLAVDVYRRYVASLLRAVTPGSETGNRRASDGQPQFKALPVNQVRMDRETAPQEITTLVGREVYTKNGVFVGEVEDLRLDLDVQQVTGLALHQLNDELFGADVDSSRGVILPYRWVQAVGDIVIINDVVERLGSDEGSDETEVAA
jgi:sporulation protein YlmC with PRC-barrel domain